MTITTLYAICTLSAVGIFAAVVLFFIAKQFHVFEDPRIDDVEEALPTANCGGCGYPGCRAFAEACTKADDLSNYYCPVGGNECMADIAKILGREIAEKVPMVAVVRCSGSPENRPKTNFYDGAPTCIIAHNLYSGETGCAYGCYGRGDCVSVCNFDAIYMDKTSELPFVIEEKCTSCGACVTACPKNIIELRKIGPKSRRIFVSCVNKDKGGLARKACKAACIGCKLCVKECKFDAITIDNNLAYIDFEKCKLCRKCVGVCPTEAIHELNFPPKPPAPPKQNTGHKKEGTTKEQVATHPPGDVKRYNETNLPVNTQGPSLKTEENK
ncbi:MAG: Fe-S cluster domain-containing protein [Thermodesulfobacteriota bacterium]|nr:Fe-S cluster domain-containing protein [Thermodesulfobacteriota bacterium]